MGRYINQTSIEKMGTSAESKISALLNDGAKEVPQPTKWVPNLVCVVDNGIFAAAGYCDSPSEYTAFTYAGDTRPKRWFIWDKAEQFASK
jgi:hypothetical protein